MLGTVGIPILGILFVPIPVDSNHSDEGLIRPDKRERGNGAIDLRANGIAPNLLLQSRQKCCADDLL